jgi:hypothetical protein
MRVVDDLLLPGLGRADGDAQFLVQFAAQRLLDVSPASSLPPGNSQ